MKGLGEAVLDDAGQVGLQFQMIVFFLGGKKGNKNKEIKYPD
jgi:hypothetical protein